MKKLSVHIMVISFLLLTAHIYQTHGGATVEQMKQSLAMVRSVCLPKMKITNEMADGLRGGNVPNEKPLKCYIHCCLELTGMMKKNKLNYEGTLKQIDMLMPDEFKAPYRSAVQVCKDSGVGIKDACEAATAIYKCMTNENPEMLFP